MKGSIIRTLPVLLTLIAGILFGSCTKYEEMGPAPEEEVLIKTRFSVRVPGVKTPSTRALTGFNESEIRSVDIVVFDKKGSYETISEHYVVNSYDIDQPDNSAGSYEAVFPVRLRANAKATTVVIVANASASMADAVLEGRSKKDFLEQLYFASSNSSQNYKWDTSSSYTPIPMYGEALLSSGGLSASTELKNISMTRMLAAVDVFNNANNFTVTSVMVANYYTAGNIAPAWNEADGSLVGTLPEDPMPCATGVKSGMTEATAMTYPDNISVGASLEREIYLYECKKASGGDADQARIGAPCLIITGKIAGDPNEYYYRIDFTDCQDVSGNKPGSAGFDPSTVQYMPLYRNHRYTINIQKAEGRGYDTFEQALRSLSVLSNLKTTLHMVDETLDYVVFNGQYYLGVEKKTLSHPWWESENYPINIKTNYPGGWLATIENASGKTWLRLDNGVTNYQGTTADFNLPIKFIPTNMGYDPELMGVISVTAGRLSLDIEVEKKSMAEVFAKSNVVMLDVGGADERVTFATSQAQNAHIPANLQGLHFKFGSLIGVNCDAPASSVTYAGSHIVFKPEEYSGNPNSYTVIPFYNMTANMQPDEFITYFPGTGYNASTAVGDICRYISDKGWVEGRWRIPTVNEWDLLYKSSTYREPVSDPWSMIPVVNVSDTWGTSPLSDGWWLGGEASWNKQAPAESTIFLPAGGYRSGSYGRLDQHNTLGYYWSTSALATGNTRVYKMFISDEEVNPQDNSNVNDSADRHKGNSVRCIRDYKNE